MRSTRPLVRLLAPVLATGLLLTACGGDDKPESKESHGSESKPAEPQTWPFTGLKASSGESVERDYTPLVVKIPYNSHADPVAGLSKADMVIEEMVEGNTSRLAAVYYSKLAKNVGPVRSMRATDIGVAGPINGRIVTSGAAAPTIKRLNQSGIKFLGEGAPGMSRASDRTAPYNLMTDLTKTAKKTTDGKKSRPSDYLPWSSGDDMPKGAAPASSVVTDMGGEGSDRHWTFKNGTYVDSNSFSPAGDAFKPNTILVLRAKVVDAGYKDPAGNFVPETKFVGNGKVQLFHDGKVVNGTWHKDKLASEIQLKTADGKEMKVPAGKVWLSLIPSGKSPYAKGSVKITK